MVLFQSATSATGVILKELRARQSATRDFPVADNEMRNLNIFRAVAAVADKSWKIRKKWRWHPSRSFVVHPNRDATAG